MNLSEEFILRNRYRIQRELGEGGFGKTYLAIDKNLNREVVIKQLIPPKEAQLEDVKRRFQREVNTLVKISDENLHIPRIDDYFIEQGIFFLVQEYVNGENLAEFLKRTKPWNNDELIKFLKEVLEILVFVHENKIIHRDIKPSNIMRRCRDGKYYLIDFGAIKELTINSEIINPSSKIGTLGYIAPEQFSGNPQYCSDIYSLGKVAIEGVIRLSPESINQLLHNQDQLISKLEEQQIEHDLAKILAKMVAYYFLNRYQSAQEVLKDLEQLNDPDHHRSGSENLFPIEPPKPQPDSEILNFFKKPFGLLLLGLFLPIIVIGIYHIIYPPQVTCLKDKIYDPTVAQYLSCGEKSITKDITYDKQQAISAFAKGQYEEAFKLFDIVFRETKDPETLIFRENAKIEKDRISSDKIITIAVSIPLGKQQHEKDLSLTMLKGVSQRQREWNDNSKTWKLRVIIANDFNDIDQSRARKVANELVEHSDIIAVNGYYSSRVTGILKPVYFTKNKVLLGLGTADDLKENNLSTFFFRVTSTNSQQAAKIINYLINPKFKQNIKKILIFYNNRGFSADFVRAVRSKWDRAIGNTKNLKPLNERDLYDLETNINHNNVQKKLTDEPASAIIICPDVKKVKEENITDIISKYYKKHPIIGCNTLYHFYPLEQKVSKKLLFSLPWYPDDDKVMRKYNELWSKKCEEPDETRYALSYDAINVLIRATDELFKNKGTSKDSLELQKILVNNFPVKDGLTGQITFKGNSERSPSTAALVRYVCNNNNCKWEKIKE